MPGLFGIPLLAWALGFVFGVMSVNYFRRGYKGWALASLGMGLFFVLLLIFITPR